MSASSVLFFITLACGGAVGAISRYLVTQSFPLVYGTLIVNVIGSFLIGVAFASLEKLSPLARDFLTVGFLGAFTTFSTFSLETVKLLQDRFYGVAFLYTLSSVVLAVLACAFGIWLVQKILSF